MNASDLFSLIKALQADFPTIERVERTDSQKVVAIRVIDFSPIRKSRKYTIMAAIYDGKPEKNEFSDYYLGKYDRIELFHIAETHKSGSSEFQDSLYNLTVLGIGFMKVQVVVEQNKTTKTASIVCRVIIPLFEKPENPESEILAGLKDLLAMHYQAGFNNVVSKLSQTGLDDKTVMRITEKYRIKIGDLLAPDASI